MKVGNYTVGVLTAQVNYVLKDWDRLKQVELKFFVIFYFNRSKVKSINKLWNLHLLEFLLQTIALSPTYKYPSNMMH